MMTGYKPSRLRPGWLAGGLVAVLLCGPLASAVAQETDLSISLIDGRLSLEAEDVPLRQVLEALAEKSGFSVELRGELAGIVSQSIVGIPLHLAIAQILGTERLSYVLEFAPAPSAGTARELAKLTVISRQAATGPATDGPARGEVIIDESRDQFKRSPDENQPDENQEAIEILEDILREEDDPLIREAALEALEDIGTAARGM